MLAGYLVQVSNGFLAGWLVPAGLAVVLAAGVGWWLPGFAVRYAHGLLQLYSANQAFSESRLLLWATGLQPWQAAAADQPPPSDLIPGFHDIPLFGGTACEFSVSPRLRLLTIAVLCPCTGMLSFYFGFGLPFWYSFLAILVLLVLAIIDERIFLLPDIFTLGLLWMGLLAHRIPGLKAIALPEAVLGAATGYLSLALLFCLYRWIRRQEGMGHGDFKLVAALGAWLGWQALPQLLLLACAGSVLYTLLLGMPRQTWQCARPFGPFLVAGGLLAFFTGLWPIV